MPDLGPCTYVTRKWGVHDERWTKALQDVGFQVRALSCERDQIDTEELQGAIDDPGPILAGPLNSVTPALVGLENRLVGLSWGFDLLEMRECGEDLSWLTHLDALIVDSTATREVALSNGLIPAKVHTIPWGIDLELFSETGATADLGRWGVPGSAITVLSLRAHEPIYRVADIIGAFSQLLATTPEAHLVIGNDGSLRVELENQVAALGITKEVTFIGTLPESELPPLLRACDLYVTASEVDGSSVTLLQAISCGVPVVASDTPGNRDWVQDQETGRLFVTGSTDDLARALGTALNPSNADSTTWMATSARDRVRTEADWSQNSIALAEIMAPRPRGSS